MSIKNKYGSTELVKDYGPVTFGNALEAYRKCEEFIQKDFAELLGISPRSLCDLEKGRRIPSPRRAAKIAEKIGQPEQYWIQLSLQDMLRKERFVYKVSVA